MSCAAGQMKMRATVKRTTATADAYGTIAAQDLADWQITDPSMRCLIWVRTPVRDTVDGEKVVVVEEIRGIFPKAADIERDDMIVEVKDRAGNDIFTGNFQVDTITKRTAGAVVTHKEAVLRRHVG